MLNIDPVKVDEFVNYYFDHPHTRETVTKKVIKYLEKHPDITVDELEIEPHSSKKWINSASRTEREKKYGYAVTMKLPTHVNEVWAVWFIVPKVR